MLRWLVIGTFVGCSHAAPSQHEPVGSSQERGSSAVTAAASDAIPTDSASMVSASNARGNGDERRIHAVDGRVVGSSVQDGKVRLVIALPARDDELDLKVGWAGAFMKEGKPMPGTDFKVTKVAGKTAWAEIPAGALPDNKPPVETVRMYEARNRSMLENG